MDRNGNEERLWNREYGKMMCSNFMLFFSFYLLSPLLPIYLAERFGSDKDTIGLVLSGYVIAALLVRPFSGFIVDTFDRRKVLMVCFFLFFICFAGYLGAVTLPLFAVVRTFHGLPFGSATVANSTAAIDALPSSRRNEGIGYYGLSNNLAMAVAPSAGIWLYSLTDDFRLLFWISLIVAGIGFYCTTTVRLPARPPVEGKPRLSLDRFFLTRAWLMAANILLFGLCWGVMGNYVAIYGKEVFGITNGAGVFFALLSIGLVISRLYGAKSLREGRLAENRSEEHTSELGRLYTVLSLAGRVGLLWLCSADRTGQRPHVSRFSEYVHLRGPQRSAGYGQLDDPDFVGPRHGIGHLHRRRADRVCGLCGGFRRHGLLADRRSPSAAVPYTPVLPRAPAAVIRAGVRVL